MSRHGFKRSGAPDALSDPAAATVSAPPAGGAGATAGAYDTAANRDLMIASINALIADVDALRTTVTAIVTALEQEGVAT